MELLRVRLQISDIDASVEFFRDRIGLVEIGRSEVEEGRGTLIFLAAPEEAERARFGDAPLLELIRERDGQTFGTGVERGHIAYQVEDLYWLCHYLLHHGITIQRPPRDGRMARVQSPDGHVIDLWQQGNPREPAEPWVCMDDIDPDGAVRQHKGRNQSFDRPRGSGVTR